LTRFLVISIIFFKVFNEFGSTNEDQEETKSTRQVYTC